MARLPLLNMISPSPLKTLEMHMEKVAACAQKLQVFFEATSVQNWDVANMTQEHIANLEREADALKQDLRLHLPKSLFLPVPRTDLLLMLTFQDAIANKAKDIAGLVLGRQMGIPVNMQANFKAFLGRCLDAVLQAQTAINQLDDLLEAGFRGNEVKVVENMVMELDAIERDTDDLQIKLRRDLFALENTLPAVNVIFLYKIIEWTGDLADGAHTVGGQLLLLLAH